MNDWTCVPEGSIRIIHLPKPKHRRAVHKYLETHYPEINKTSLTVYQLPAARSRWYLKQCPHCSQPYVHLNDYCWTGLKCDYATGQCHTCGEYLSCDISPDDDNLYQVNAHNAIAIGCLANQCPWYARRSVTTKLDYEIARLVLNHTYDVPSSPDDVSTYINTIDLTAYKQTK